MAEAHLDDIDFESAVTLGEAERRQRPIPVAARYEPSSGRVVITFSNDAVFMVPAAQLQDLGKAAEHDLMDIEVLGETGIHWPKLDVDLTIDGLMSGVFGTASFIEVARKGGQMRSDIKAAAARQNGQKGGRPRKSS